MSFLLLPFGKSPSKASFLCGFILLWIELCPPQIPVVALTPVPQNRTLFGNRVLVDNQVKMRLLVWVLAQYDTHPGRMPLKMRADFQVILLQAKKHQRFPAHNQKLGESHNIDSSLEPSEVTKPADTLISDFSIQNCDEISFCCSNHPISGILLQQPEQIIIVTQLQSFPSSSLLSTRKQKPSSGKRQVP